MKTAGTIAIVTLGLVTATAAEASPSKARAGKKRAAPAKKVAVGAEAPAPSPRRLSDELGLGLRLAAPGAAASDDADAADDGAAPAERAAPATGATFTLGGRDRRAEVPSGDGAIRMEAQPLTAAQVGAVVRAHTGDLEYCWNRLPASRRTGGAIALHLTIEPRGAVEAVTVGGDVPAAAARCIEAAARRWTFPLADTTSLVDYPVVLK